MPLAKEELIKRRIESDYNKLVNEGYEVVGVFLQGSQNYGLDYEDSDIDTKAIVLPPFRSFITKDKLISSTIVLPSDEHIDVKDVRPMFDCFKKQNVNFVEILYTKYFKLNPKYEKIYSEVVKHRDWIARYNTVAAVSCLQGMTREKLHALEHLYPKKIEIVQTYGYDPKQLHHIVRMNEFLKRYISGESYESCLISKERDYLVSIKRLPPLYSHEEAIKVANEVSQETINICKDYISKTECQPDKRVDKLLEDTTVKLFEQYYFKDRQITSKKTILTNEDIEGISRSKNFTSR